MGDLFPDGKVVMGKYRKFSAEYREEAVRMVLDSSRPIAVVARDLGINEGTLGNWCAVERRRREGGQAGLSEDERAELVRLRKVTSAKSEVSSRYLLSGVLRPTTVIPSERTSRSL